MRWRWDQGRLEYFSFDNVVKIAKVLSEFDGIDIQENDACFRKRLIEDTELPFSPSNYKVWRNYARVFRCSMLATDLNGKLIVSSLCRYLADSKNNISPDQYLCFVYSHFALPYPAFQDYDAKTKPVYPFTAILKFIIGSVGTNGASLEDIFNFVIGNDCTGLEDIGFYRHLKPTNRRPDGDEERQVREMMVFLGQASFMKWFNGRLYIDTTDIESVIKATLPQPQPSRSQDPRQEFFSMTEVNDKIMNVKYDIALKDRNSLLFTVSEGSHQFATHGKIERSPLVRKYFFIAFPEIVCNACGIEPQKVYPWTDNILELHHILPLSATLNMNGTTTTLDDMVALCPNCHKSIHRYYQMKLSEWGIADFCSKKMANDVYQMARREICR